MDNQFKILVFDKFVKYMKKIINKNGIYVY